MALGRHGSGSGLGVQGVSGDFSVGPVRAAFGRTKLRLVTALAACRCRKRPVALASALSVLWDRRCVLGRRKDEIALDIVLADLFDLGHY